MTSFARQIDLFHDQAANFVGYNDFGDSGEYRNNLARMLEFSDTEVDWTDFGKQLFPQKVVGSLCSRLYAQRGFEKFPDFLQQPICKPIIVEGFRSGTTLFHQMLSSLSDTQSLPFWLTSFPMPRPPKNTWKNYPEMKRVSAGIELMNEMGPGLRDIHPMLADEADENHRADQTYVTLGQLAYMWSPGYMAWIDQQIPEMYFERFRKLLQLIGYGNPNKWVLKCPMQMGWAAQTRKQFPDASLVHTYRDPSETLPSLINLIYLVLSPCQNIDKKEFGSNLAETFGAALDRYIESRTMDKSDRYLDIGYKDIVSDPLGCARKVYTHSDGDFSEARAAQIAEWFSTNNVHKPVKPNYTAEDYGLSKGVLRERMARYIDFYGL